MAKASIWRPIFLEQLRITGNVSEAAEFAGITRRGAYQARQRSERFADLWDEALEQACDRMEREAFRRAVEGTNKPVFYQGSECGVIREYSDTLLIFLLKAHRPDKFRERSSIEMTGKDGGPIEHSHRPDLSQLTDEELDALGNIAQRFTGNRGRESET